MSTLSTAVSEISNETVSKGWEVQFVLDNRMNNHLDLYSTFSLKGLKSLHTSVLTISLNRKKSPSLLALCGLWSLYSFELVKPVLATRFSSPQLLCLQGGYNIMRCGERPIQKS